MAGLTRIHKFRKIINKSLKQKKLERCYFYCLIFVVGIGFVADWIVKFGWSLLSIENLDDYCSNLLSIQSAIAILPIALIALLSNLISKSYLGVSISSYILDFKHCFFKFKFIFYAEMVLLLASILFQMLTFYNFIFASLLVSILLICITVKNFCEVYTDLYSIYDEIIVYWNCRLLRKSKNYKDIGILFIEDWKRSINNNISKEEFDLYCKLYFKLIRRILYKGRDFRLVNSLTEALALFLLEHENKKVKEHGIEFVIIFYERILKILRSLKKTENITDSISLISRSKVNSEWNEANKVFEQKNENINKLGVFALDLLKVAISNGSSSVNEDEKKCAYSIAYGLGCLLGKQCDKQKNINCFDEHIRRMSLYSYCYSCDMLDYYFKIVAILNFNFIKGYLFRKKTDFVKEYLLILLRKQNARGQIEKYVFEIMLIHSYLYYLTYRESKEFVGSDDFLQEMKELLTDNIIVKQIYRLFTEYIVKNCRILNSALEKYLESILKDCELHPSNGAKFLIMENVVRIYFLYVVLLASEKSKSNSLNCNPLDALELNSYRNYLFKSKNEDIQEKLQELSKIFGEDNKAVRVAARFNFFRRWLHNKVKEEIKETQAEKLKKLRESRIDEQLKYALNGQFNRYFKNNSCINSGYCLFSEPIEVYNKNEFTDYLVGDCPIGYITTVSHSMLIKKIADLLILKHGIKSKKVDRDFSDYESLRDYIFENKYNLLVGNPYFLWPQKWIYDDQISNNQVEFFKIFEIIDIDGSELVIATQKGKFGITLNHINLSILSLSSEEINSCEEINRKIIEKSSFGKILYQYSNEITLEFDDEKEFIEFTQNYIQKIEISFDVSVYAISDNKIEATVFV